jgi:hypothetical protein
VLKTRWICGPSFIKRRKQHRFRLTPTLPNFRTTLR